MEGSEGSGGSAVPCSSRPCEPKATAGSLVRGSAGHGCCGFRCCACWASLQHHLPSLPKLLRKAMGRGFPKGRGFPRTAEGHGGAGRLLEVEVLEGAWSCGQETRGAGAGHCCLASPGQVPRWPRGPGSSAAADSRGCRVSLHAARGPGAQCSRRCRMFYSSHLLPHRRCHLALSQPGFLLPDASPLHQAQRLQRAWSPGSCCHFQMASGRRLVPALLLGGGSWLLFTRDECCFLSPRCFLPQMLPEHPPFLGKPMGMPSRFAGPPAFCFAPCHFTLIKPSCSGSFALEQKFFFFFQQKFWAFRTQKKSKTCKAPDWLGR